MKNHTSKLDSVILFFLGLIIFTIGTCHEEIVGFEARFYLFAVEMWRHGFSFFPTTYGQPYPDYPGTSTALILLAAKLFGGLNKLTAILPSAIAAALTLVVTYLLGATESRKWGWYAAGFLLFTNAFLMISRSLALDSYVTLFTTFSFYVAYSAKLQQKKMPLWVLLMLFACSFAIRGPLGLIIPTGVTCVFYLLEKDFKNFFLAGFSAFVLLLVLSATLLGLAYHVGGKAFLQDVLRMEVFGRMQEMRTPSHTFYFVESIGAYAVTYPLCVLMLPALLPRLSELKFIRSLLGWVLIILLGLSLPADKKVRYILPVAPALSLIAAYLFVMQSPRFYLRSVKFVFGLLYRFFPLLGLCGVWFLALRHIEVNYSALVFVLVIAQLLMLFFWRREWTFFLAVLSFVVFYVLVVEEIDLQSNKTRDFVQSVEDLRFTQHAKLVFFAEGTDGVVIKYMADMPREDMPLFISDVKKIPQNSFVLISSEKYQAMNEKDRANLQVIQQGKIGHEEFLISRNVSHS